MSIYFLNILKVFFEDLNNLSADKSVEEYGTHILTDITIGRQYISDFRSIISEEIDTQSKQKIVSAGVAINISKFGFNLDKETDKTISTTLNKKNQKWVTKVECHGGEGNGNSYTFNNETGITNVNININAWQSSINAKNAKLVDLNWNKTYLIYDFIHDPIKKETIKKAVEKYIKDRQVDIINVKALYRYYNTKTNDHLSTTNWSEFGNVKTNWLYEGIQGYVLTDKRENTVAIYRYYSRKSQDHLLTTNWYEFEKGKDGWSYEGIVGYAYDIN